MKDVYTVDDITLSLRRVVARLNDSCVINNALTSTTTSKKSLLHTHMQVVFNLKFSNQCDRMIHELIMRHAIAAEKLGPGAFDRCIDLVATNTSTVETTVMSNSVTLNDTMNIIDKYASQGGARTVEMLKEAVCLAGFCGRVIVEKTTSTVPSIELVRGYTFELQQFLPIDVNFLNPRVTCIDGYIESVSEIHHLLEAASEAKEPLVMFVRGMSDDVKHTLKVNYDRGSLRVIPIGVSFDLDGMNTLVDLSMCTGTTLVSSLKGDLISSIKFHELPTITQMTLYKGRTVVVCATTAKAVTAHVSVLRKRRQEEQIDDVGKLLDNRIRSLTPNHVIMRLPNNLDYIVNSQAIDYALRAIKSTIEHGVINGVPAATELAAQAHARSCLLTISCLGSYITH